MSSKTIFCQLARLYTTPYEFAAAINEVSDASELSFDESLTYAKIMHPTTKPTPSAQICLAPLVRQFTEQQTVFYEGVVDYNYHTPYHVGTLAANGRLRPYL